jgi:hypothetical protein
MRNELRELDELDTPDVRSRMGQPTRLSGIAIDDVGPSHAHRTRAVTILAATLLVIGVALYGLWGLGTSTNDVIPGSTSTAPGLGTYVNPSGIPITFTYPTGWFAASVSQTSDGLSNGAAISNVEDAVPSTDPGPMPDASPPLDYVRVAIFAAYGRTTPILPDSELPLSMDNSKPAPGPENLRELDAQVAGVPLVIEVSAGPNASQANLAAADAIVASIRPSPNPNPSNSESAGPGGGAATASERILDAFGPSPISSIEDTNGTIKVVGQASAPGGEVARTEWYEGVAAGAMAQLDSVRTVDELVLDPSGNQLDSNTDDPADFGTRPNPFADITLTPSDVAAITSNMDPALGVTVTGTHYVGLFGGGAEVVVRPDDVQGFVAHASSKLGKILGPIAEGNRPYLVTVVDAAGRPQLIIGHMPGMGSALGEGLGWVAPGMQTDAIIGQPVSLNSVQPSP